ncbi:sensor histidine kinase [Coralliovum pocilloporae]|uniref:sensor histidine kinase n=1 Tax=Coralliovum pocilloporae TaxID=3066369 RepID=UPI0033079E87
MISKALKESLKGRLTRRLVMVVIGISLLTAILTTVLQVYFENSHRRERFAYFVEHMAASHMPLLSRWIENGDQDGLALGLSSLDNLPKVDFAAIQINGRTLGSSGALPEEPTIEKRLPFDVSVDGVTKKATLLVISHYPTITRVMILDGATLLILNMIQILFIACALLLVFHLLVIRHLDKLADYVSGLDVRRLQKPLVFERPAADDELQDVADATNEMTQRLAQTYDDLQQFNYFASHDLQEPLRKVCIFGDVLKDSIETGDRKEIEYSISVMQDSADRASNLVTDLLTFSRISRRDSQSDWVPLETIVSIALENNQTAIAETGIRVISNLRDLSIRIDRGMGTQLFDNLISNAVKYQHPDRPSFVRITADVDEEHVLKIFVEDNGIGFDNRHLDKIFEPFKRLHPRADFAGSGIGLAIVRKIVERAGWQITARGEPGGGATFIVTVPSDCVIEGSLRD